MNNAVIYARYSSTGQNEQTIEGQIRVCKEFAENKGLNVIKTYIDKAKTGTNDKRPDFQKMMGEAASGAFQYVIVYMFDRFARNRVDSIIHKQQLKAHHDIRVLSALEPVSDDEGGEFYEMYLEWNAEKYSKRLSKRVRDGLDTSVANGTFCGGHLIYGYKLNKEPIAGKNDKFIKTVVIDEEQAKIVRFIFEEYGNNAKEKKEIAAALNEQGYRYNDKLFKGRIFDKWLVNEKYTGEFSFGERVSNNMYPQIIDKPLFERVQERLRKNQYFLGGTATAKEPYLLTGKLKCGHCSTDMVSDGGTSKTGKRHYYYACKKKKKDECDKKRENKDNLELSAVQAVVRFCRKPDNLNKMAEEVLAHHEQRASNDGLRSIEVRIAKAQQEVEEMTTAYIGARNDLLRTSIEKRMSEQELFLKDLQRQKAQIELERGLRVTKQSIIIFVHELIKGDENDKEYQRRIIDNLISMVYIYDDKLVAYLTIGNGKLEIDVSLDDTNTALNSVLGVPTRSPSLRQ